jgi:ribosomal protein S27AE
MDILWDLYQQRQIYSAEQSASDANRKATDVQQRVHELEDSVDRLVLINTAMWELLKNRLGLSEQELLKQIETVDLRDGVADGRITRAHAVTCPKCGRSISTKHRRCLYCGAKDVTSGAFTSVR